MRAASLAGGIPPVTDASHPPALTPRQCLLPDSATPPLGHGRFDPIATSRRHGPRSLDNAVTVDRSIDSVADNDISRFEPLSWPRSDRLAHTPRVDSISWALPPPVLSSHVRGDLDDALTSAARSHTRFRLAWFLNQMEFVKMAYGFQNFRDVRHNSTPDSFSFGEEDLYSCL